MSVVRKVRSLENPYTDFSCNNSSSIYSELFPIDPLKKMETNLVSRIPPISSCKLETYCMINFWMNSVKRDEY